MSKSSKKYRELLGFTNKEKLKNFFKAKDIVIINYEKIKAYNERLKDIFINLNEAVNKSIKYSDIDEFCDKIDEAYHIMKNSDIFYCLNNNGRTPEDVYYNWMRGYLVCEHFKKAVSKIFNIKPSEISIAGHDSLTDPDTFSKSPTADLEFTKNNKTIRLEIQSGFTGKNDIKKHKIKEAKNIYKDEGITSYVVHFDLFNGTAAVINTTKLSKKNIKWKERGQFEGQEVFEIPDDWFVWRITDEPKSFKELVKY